MFYFFLCFIVFVVLLIKITYVWSRCHLPNEEEEWDNRYEWKQIFYDFDICKKQIFSLFFFRSLSFLTRFTILTHLCVGVCFFLLYSIYLTLVSITVVVVVVVAIPNLCLEWDFGFYFIYFLISMRDSLCCVV